ncbi:MAG: nicotinate-nicotinamide nucleotide adenylyltransferase [Thermoleophilia bacterium]|nr:nicotinate-nicotinamide nucleotide adenylyltransferase [Thermoleophilia bacterium]
MMNPPHLGHRAVVDAVHAACGLDRVVVVPAGIPPHRRAPQVSARARLTMAVRAFADLDHVVVSDSEVERGEDGDPGYMVDTVAEVIEAPASLGYDDLEVHAWLVVGADQAATLHSWERWEQLRGMARIAIVARPDQIAADTLAATVRELEAGGAEVDLVPMPEVPISSTIVRDVAATGDVDALRALIPEAIVNDVLQLYGPSTS